MNFTRMELCVIANAWDVSAMAAPPMVTADHLREAERGIADYGLPPACDECAGWGFVRAQAHYFGDGKLTCKCCYGLGYRTSRGTALVHVPGNGYGVEAPSTDLKAARLAARAFDAAWFLATERIADALMGRYRGESVRGPDYTDYRAVLQHELEFHEIIACRVALEMTPYARAR